MADTTERKLLIIDDLDLLRIVLRRIMGKSFREIEEAADYDGALQAIGKLERGDVIISDLHLSDSYRGDGLELASITMESRRQLANTFILSSSASREKDLSEIQQSLDSGIIDGFVPKPYDATTMRITVQAAVAKKLQHSGI